MFLCIDQGNSRTKTAIFDEAGKLVKSEAFIDDSLRQIKSMLNEFTITHAIISTTGKTEWELSELELPGVMITLSHSTPLPIEILYTTPETLGRDRIAAACGAFVLFPGKNCLVVDAGTCITMDLLLAKGIYLGGNISPGVEMRLWAMHKRTARLPLVEPGFPILAFGDSTEHALQNGGCMGAVMEIEGILYRAKEAYGDVLVVITGGDSALLATRLESQIFVEPELVTQGLFQILSFNVTNSN